MTDSPVVAELVDPPGQKNRTDEEWQRTPQEWAALDGLTILDPDGWRTDDAPPFDAPCSRDEYVSRIGICTIGRLVSNV